MTIQVFPEPVVTSGDPASKTFPATAAGTYTMGYTLSAGVYEVTTDTSQSSHTITFETAAGYRFSGTVRGGKGYVSVAADVTKIIIPSGLTYPINYNIRLGAYTQIAACTATTASFGSFSYADFTFTAPSGATNITAFWTDGTSTSFATTSSPKTSVTVPNAVNGQAATAMLVATDANGVLGVGVSVTTDDTASIPISGGAESNVYTSGGTTYLSVTFLASGTLTVNETKNIEYFIVAGGGPGGAGAGNGNAGGGGGGGSTSGTQTSVTAGTYTVTVGAGGAAFNGNTAYGSDGSSSSVAFSTTRSADGGGAGGMYAGVTNTRVPGKSGGCGGGGSMGYGAGNLAGGTATAGQGNNGGNGQNYGAGNWQGGGGGGGGGGAAGGNCTTGAAGDGGNGNGQGRAGAGGNGISNSYRTSSSVTYAGGGGGTSGNVTYGNGAAGTGGGTPGATNPASAAANTGGGTGGCNGGTNNANGGSGIVIVRVAA